MKNKIRLGLLMLAAAPALAGCALQAALIAADVLPTLEAPLGPSNAHLKPAATQACTQRAAKHGSVYIADVEQRRQDRIIVWGSVTDAQRQRRTFECHFTKSLVRFKLGEILPPQ